MDKDTVIIQLNNEDIKMEVWAELGDGFITCGKLVAYKLISLEEMLLKKHMTAKKAGPILVDLEIFPNPAYLNSKSHVLPQDTYNVIIGENFGGWIREKRHDLIFQSSR